jgi:hypothetical protein
VSHGEKQKAPETPVEDARTKFVKEMEADLVRERSARHFERVCRSKTATLADLFEACDFVETEK